MSDDTLPTRPNQKDQRPRTGLSAWESTVGYLSSHINPNAMLTLRVSPKNEDDNLWAARLEWEHEEESVENQESLPVALRELWSIVGNSHAIFHKANANFHKPEGYGEFDWVDADTRDALERLIWVARVVFKTDWTLVIIYQALDNAENRVQARLAARKSTVHIGGRGASIQDAVTQLYRNATPYFSKEKD